MSDCEADMTGGRIRCYFICGPAARDRTPGQARRFGTELNSAVPDARFLGAGPDGVRLASGRWEIRATPSVLKFEHEGLGVDWAEFRRLANGALAAYFNAFGPLLVETAVLGCALSLDFPAGPRGLSRVFQVYPVLTHPLAAGIENFRLGATFRGPHVGESFRVYLAGQPGPEPDRLGLVFELDYCRHFLGPVTPADAADWLETAPVVFNQLLSGSLLERENLGTQERGGPD